MYYLHGSQDFEKQKNKFQDQKMYCMISGNAQ